MRRQPTYRAPPRTRRDVLRAGALATLGLSLATACGTDYAEGPDPLAPLLEQARADAVAAESLAAAKPDAADLARQVAAVRSAHADAIGSEVDRQNRPQDNETTPTPDHAAASLDELKQRLTTATGQAVDVSSRVPAYRAGLLASVAAGCAAAKQLAGSLGRQRHTDPVQLSAESALDDEAISGLQRALETEHAAVWVYGLVTAFLPKDFASGLREASTAHQQRRDGCAGVLTAAGTTPHTAQPAYVPPQPVTDEASAMALVALAESDTAAAWRGVIDRTEDTKLRSGAIQALVSAASRTTRWRAEAGQQPAVIALPGQPRRA